MAIAMSQPSALRTRQVQKHYVRCKCGTWLVTILILVGNTRILVGNTIHSRDRAEVKEFKCFCVVVVSMQYLIIIVGNTMFKLVALEP